MKKIIAPFLVVLFIVGCGSSLQIMSDYDKEADFTKYKTYSYYGWSKDSDKLLNRFDKERIEAAFADEFNKRGMKYVEDGGDVVVSLFLVLDQKTARTAYTDHYGGGYGYGWGWGMGHSTTRYHEYDYVVGTLVCDVFDTETKKLVWQGVGTKTIDDKPEKREKRIPYTIGAIMSQYPIKPIDKK